MQKLFILQSFHRYVLTGEFRTVTKPGGARERVELELEEVLVQGTRVEMGDDLAADWIAKGLARAVEVASADDAGTAVSGMSRSTAEWTGCWCLPSRGSDKPPRRSQET